MRHLSASAALLLLAACGGQETDEPRNMSAEEVAETLSGMKIEAGQWEATNEIVSATAPGMPGDVMKQMIGQKTTVSNCITPEQAQKPSANFLAAQQNNNCTYQNWVMQGGRMSGTMICQGGAMPGRVVMQMDGNYAPTQYQLNMDMNTSGLPNGMTMNIKAKTTGRRVGECTRT
jgi:hypothetical protein